MSTIDINLFDNKDINFYITNYNNINNLLNYDIEYDILISLDSKDIYITNTDSIYKITDIFFYDKEYNNDNNDIPIEDIFPGKLYYNNITSNLYLSQKIDDKIIFNDINIFSDYTKKISINEINLGYFNKKTIDLFKINFNINDKSLIIESINKNYSFNVNDFYEYKFGYYITTAPNRNEYVNIFSFKKDFSNISSNILNINKNFSIIDGSLYRKYFYVGDNIPRISIDDFENNINSIYTNMYEAIINSKVYFKNINNKLIALYEIDNNNLKNKDVFTTSSELNKENDLMDLLTFMMVKIHYLEKRIS